MLFVFATGFVLALARAGRPWTGYRLRDDPPPGRTGGEGRNPSGRPVTRAGLAGACARVSPCELGHLPRRRPGVAEVLRRLRGPTRRRVLRRGDLTIRPQPGPA